MNKFKVGDHVNAYNNGSLYGKGIIQSIDGDIVYIVHDGGTTGYGYHYKQCRKLKRKYKKHYYLIDYKTGLGPLIFESLKEARSVANESKGNVLRILKLKLMLE